MTAALATDQFLTDPRACKFDPKVLQCTGSNVPPACLTAEQVTTMRNVLCRHERPAERAAHQSRRRARQRNRQHVCARPRVPGAPAGAAFDGLFYWVFGPSFGVLSSATNYANFDFHRDVARSTTSWPTTLNAVSTDLGEFNRRGNKLLMYHGWADPLIPPPSSINYFNALVKAHGRNHAEVQQVDFRPGDDRKLAATQSYARLFMVPGMYHCAGGPGPNVFDALTPLVQWVEQGVAPETIVATKFVDDTPPAVQMTRPLCVFPKVAKYTGSGNPNVAANFVCVARRARLRRRRRRSSGPDDV